MKTNIVGWLYIIASPFFIFPFVIFTISIVFSIIFSGGLHDPLTITDSGILPLFLGIFCLIFGSSLKKHKKWSWFVGIIIVPLVTMLNFFALFFYPALFHLLPLVLILNMFSFYALISEKKLFFRI